MCLVPGRMSVWCGSGAAARLLTVLCLTAGCAAVPQQQSEVRRLTEAVGRLQPLVDTLVTKLSSQESLVAGLQTRVEELALQVEGMAKTRPHDCSELPWGANSSVYSVWPDRSQGPVQVFCQEDIDGGKMWTVFQRRDDLQPRQDFSLGWDPYKKGFGSLTGEFWLGLEDLYKLTATQNRLYELRIDLEAFDGAKRHASYSRFRVSNEEDGYRLHVSGYTGDAGDALSGSDRMRFSTRDRDNDLWAENSCAVQLQGAWWYGGGRCSPGRLNGVYLERGDVHRSGILWETWKRSESLKKVQMKIRTV